MQKAVTSTFPKTRRDLDTSWRKTAVANDDCQLPEPTNQQMLSANKQVTVRYGYLKITSPPLDTHELLVAATERSKEANRRLRRTKDMLTTANTELAKKSQCITNTQKRLVDSEIKRSAQARQLMRLFEMINCYILHSDNPVGDAILDADMDTLEAALLNRGRTHESLMGEHTVVSE